MQSLLITLILEMEETQYTQNYHSISCLWAIGFPRLVPLCMTRESLISKGLPQLLTKTVHVPVHTDNSYLFKTHQKLRKMTLYRAPLIKAKLESSNWTHCG